MTPNRSAMPRAISPGMTASGVDAHGDVRIAELAAHPFFLATLFVPQVASAKEHPHPLIRGFAAAAVEWNRRGERGSIFAAQA